MPEFRWTLHDEAGNRLRATETFATQGAAEEWMGEEWSALLDEGAESVALESDEGEILYRMGLREE